MIESPERPVGERPAPSREPLTMKSLLEAGVHFGHQTRRWNPQMKRYIFTQRNGIHIVDLQQTLGLIHEAYRAMIQVTAAGGKVLFVGTKRQAQEVIQSEAQRCGMWYVNQRWLGGTLTNFQTIRSRVNYMIELQQKRDQGYFRVLPKKEAVKLEETLNRLEKYFLGIQDMTELPAALFIIDIGKENICIAEAQRMGVQVFAIVDTDCDPGKVDHAIPGNDDAVRSIRLITSRLASAALEGLEQREAMLQAEAEEAALEELEQREAMLQAEADEDIPELLAQPEDFLKAEPEEVAPEPLDQQQDLLKAEPEEVAPEPLDQQQDLLKAEPEEVAPEPLDQQQDLLKAEPEEVAPEPLDQQQDLLKAEPEEVAPEPLDQQEDLEAVTIVDADGSAEEVPLDPSTLEASSSPEEDDSPR